MRNYCIVPVWCEQCTKNMEVTQPRCNAADKETIFTLAEEKLMAFLLETSRPITSDVNNGSPTGCLDCSGFLFVDWQVASEHASLPEHAVHFDFSPMVFKDSLGNG